MHMEAIPQRHTAQRGSCLRLWILPWIRMDTVYAKREAEAGRKMKPKLGNPEKGSKGKEKKKKSCLFFFFWPVFPAFLLLNFICFLSCKNANIWCAIRCFQVIWGRNDYRIQRMYKDMPEVDAGRAKLTWSSELHPCGKVWSILKSTCNNFTRFWEYTKGLKKSQRFAPPNKINVENISFPLLIGRNAVSAFRKCWRFYLFFGS